MQENIRKKVLKGGILLAMREVVSASLSLVSVLVVARILGPEQYGVVAIVLGFFFFFSWLGRMGLNVYVVRKPDLSREEVEQILCFYNTVGVLICFILWLVAPLFGLWTGNSDVSVAFRWLIPAIWLDMIGTLASCMLERKLDFAKVSLIQALAEISNYLLSVTLVVVYKSYLAAISGYAMQFLVLAILAHYFNPIRWRYRWTWKALYPALKYGSSYSLSDWTLNLRTLTIPLLVSRLAGVEAAAIANVAFRVVQKLLLLRWVIRNMAISVIAKIMNDQEAVKHALSEGMLYQALLLGTICAAFSGFASWIVPAVFGQGWILSAQIFPCIALSIIVSALFDLHSALLYASDHNREMIRFSFVNISLLWLACLCLIPFLGVMGYGIAEVVALPSYYLVHRSLCKFYQNPDYWPAFLTVLATIPPLFGGIWLKPLPNLVLMMASYGALFLLSSTVRSASAKLLRSR